MAHRRFVVLGVGGIIALVIALTVTSLNDNLTYYLFPTEAIEQRSEFDEGERFRLAGLVVEGTVTEDGDELRFDVTDGGATIPVVLTNTPPPLFDEAVPVLLEGTWQDGTFNAEEALIRHDENYVIPEEGGAYTEP